MKGDGLQILVMLEPNPHPQVTTAAPCYEQVGLTKPSATSTFHREHRTDNDGFIPNKMLSCNTLGGNLSQDSE